jgi:FemAB-related protein (PEP-CTERM system-associated)
VTVHRLTAADRERWNRYVDSHPEATVFHRAEWDTVVRAAGRHATHFLFVEARGEIQGVLPLAHVRSWFFGNALVSTPFCVYGGILSSSDEAHAALRDAACELAKRLRVDCLELRNRKRQHPDWPCKDLYVTFRKEIDPDPEKNLKAIPRKQRAMVRKGIKNDLVGERDPDVDRFFRIYSESMRNLGTPVFPRKLFQVLREQFGESCEVLTVTRDGTPISSVLSLYFRDEVLPYYGGGTAEARALAASDFMYWDLMRRACERGLRVFDYGRSKRDVGSYRFKKHWGFDPEPLYYEYFLVRAGSVPDVNPLNPRYRLLIEAWKRLPLKLTQLLGPRIARHLG